MNPSGVLSVVILLQPRDDSRNLYPELCRELAGRFSPNPNCAPPGQKSARKLEENDLGKDTGRIGYGATRYQVNLHLHRRSRMLFSPELP